MLCARWYDLPQSIHIRPHTMRQLPLQTLTPVAFAPYGDVLGNPSIAELHGIPGETTSKGVLINAGTTEKIALGEPDLTQSGGKPAFFLYRASAVPLPFTAYMLERHCLGSQSFVPLSGVPFVVIVALGDKSVNEEGLIGAAPQENTIAAFWVDGTCGVSFKPGTWHHPLLAQRSGDFVVLERQGDRVDCEIKKLLEPVHIESRL